MNVVAEGIGRGCKVISGFGHHLRLTDTLSLDHMLTSYDCWYPRRTPIPDKRNLKRLGHQLGMRITNNCQRPLTR